MTEQKQYDHATMRCACGSTEHTLHFIFDGAENEIHTEVYLNQYRGPFKRLWIAFKYVMGYRCRYGHFDCFTMDSFGGLQQAKELHKMLTTWIENAERLKAEVLGRELTPEQQEVLDRLAEKAKEPPPPYCPTCGVDPSKEQTPGCEDRQGCGYWREFLAWYEQRERDLAEIRERFKDNGTNIRGGVHNIAGRVEEDRQGSGVGDFSYSKELLRARGLATMVLDGVAERFARWLDPFRSGSSS